MQSNKNKSTEKNTNEPIRSIDEILLENKDIFMKLIAENEGRREKSFMVAQEYDLIQKFEKNLIILMERCPPGQVNQILAMIDSLNLE